MAIVLLVGIGFLVLYPVLQNGFTNWDDEDYITQNPLIRDASWEGLGKLFLPENKTMDTYTPLTLVSFALEYSVVGLEPFLYHLDNLLLHLFNIILVFLIIGRLSNIRVAFLVALLFGIHPMHVESVAWVTERKDTLFALFFLLAIYSYQLLQDKSRAETVFKDPFYWLSILWFILSMFSKPQAVCLPVVLLLIDWYRWHKFNLKLILEKLPFFAIALFFGLLAVDQMMPSAGNHGLWDRLVLSSYATVLYIQKLFIPWPVSAHYPFPVEENGWYSIGVYLSMVGLALLTFFIFWKRKQYRVLFFGFFFFLVTLGLTLHFIKVNSAIIYDRFTYVSYIGLFFPMALLLERWFERSKAVVGIPCLAIIAALGFISHQRTKDWTDSLTLWESAIKAYPESHMAYGMRANYYLGQNLKRQALLDYITCAEKKPDFPECQNNAGLLLMQKGDYTQAIPYFNRTLEIDSTYWRAWANRAIAYENLRLYDRAIADANQAKKLMPNVVMVLIIHAVVSEKMGRLEDALEDYNLLIDGEPDNAGLLTSRGLIHFKIGNAEQALADYNLAIILNPRYGDAYYRRSKLYFYQQQVGLALADALKAQELGANLPDNYIEQLRGE